MTVSSESDTIDLKIFSLEDLALLDPKKIPNHIAIIMDGNRRWARQKNLLPIIGHWEGAEALMQVVRAASELGIKTVTVFAFSTENWARPHPEIDALMKIFELYLVREKENMIRDGVRLDAIGNLSQLPPQVQLALEETKAETKHCDKINLVLALNYGGRDEIRRAFAKILEMKIAPVELTEEMIGKQLDTSPWGDPELLIRTSGELRVSNFLLWQISYAEIYVTNVLWPDFSPQELFGAVLAFQRRGRRLGGGVV